MPEPALLAALKLGRGQPQDFHDVRWWMTERGLALEDVRAANGTLPAPAARNRAARGIVQLMPGGRDQRQHHDKIQLWTMLDDGKRTFQYRRWHPARVPAARPRNGPQAELAGGPGAPLVSPPL